jgi:hypothetical protein
LKKEQNYMETVTLERKPFTPRAETVFSSHELLERAKNVLSYSPTAVTEAKRRADEITVAKALGDLGIEPFDPAKVWKYQAAMVKKAQAKGASAFVRAMHRSTPGEIIVVFGAVAWIVSLVILGITVGAGLTAQQVAAHHVAILRALQAIGCVFAAWVVCMVARHKRAVIYSARWDSSYINNYRRPIPDFALERALQVKAALPEANFYVQELTESTNTQHTEFKPTPPDPFLVMDYRSVQLHLDVWDEPRFEGRRTA